MYYQEAGSFLRSSNYSEERTQYFYSHSMAATEDEMSEEVPGRLFNWIIKWEEGEGLG